MSHPNPSEAGQEKNSAGTGMELRRQLLSCAAETLTSKEYQVFVLRFLEGMPQKDIASEFYLSRSAVSRTYSRALYKLRKAMGYEFEDVEDLGYDE